VTIAAPCKVNLTLDVFPPRPDGFHDLESVVATFSPADVLTIEAVPALPDGESGVRLSCSDPALPTGDGNLAYRAATSFLAAFPARCAGSAPDRAGEAPTVRGGAGRREQ